MEAVERAAKVIRPILERYVEERKSIVRKYKDKEEQYDQMIHELGDLDGDYALRVEEALKEKGINAEVVWEWISENETFSGMGFSHRRVELHVCTVVSYPSAWYLIGVFEEREIYGKYEFEYLHLSATVVPIVDEETPFSLKLVTRTKWHEMRGMWKTLIESLVAEIAKAERNGKLKEVLKRVENEVKAGSWVYEYAHFYNVLQQVKREFNL